MSLRLFGNALLRPPAQPSAFVSLPQHTDLRFYSSMADARVTAKELEEAIKSRLEASHAQVTDISGALSAATFSQRDTYCL